jgi:excinuclease UvrABC ATPase subunit
MSEEQAIFGNIEIRRARVNNLNNVSLDIPKRQITVFTGVSGSGKSSLVFGTVAAESQRLVNETYPAYVQAVLPRYGQPDVDSLANLSVAVVVDQQPMTANSRSTLGTATDTYTLLRLCFSRIGRPAVSDPRALSFNDPEGMCPGCDGIGRAAAIDVDALVDRSKSLDEGAILFPAFAVGSAHWNFFASSGFFDTSRPVGEFTRQEWDTLLNGEARKVSVRNGGKNFNFTYEGLLPKFSRLYLAKGAEAISPRLREAYERVVTTGACPDCDGSRLGPAARACLIRRKNIGQCLAMQVSDLAEFLRSIDEPSVAPLIQALVHRLDSLSYLGLGYLSLDRESGTLSGGESQRVKLVRHFGSSLTDMTYIFDEPTAGLHPHNVRQLNQMLCQLRDKGNTVLVVEHKPEVMAISDHLVDMGPGAGSAGGNVVYQGDFAGLRKAGTVTGQHLSRHQQLKTDPRPGNGTLRIAHASLHNLRRISLELPRDALTVITGVAGSGKSSLAACLPRFHPDAIFIDQSIPKGSRRSNPATYTGMLDPIRKAFAAANNVSPALFSSNSEGACPECDGLGVVYTDLAHLDPVVSLCRRCGGSRFSAEVLRHTLRGRTISEVLQAPAAQAVDFFVEPEILSRLQALIDVGLGYLSLAQPVSTLSGGERQRLKLANELGRRGQLYVLDEPTTGLHMNDVDHLIGLLDRLVDDGSTVIVIEHNLDVIARADWVVDLGPGAGDAGGRVVFEGRPAALVTTKDSLTGDYLRRRLAERNR